MKTKNILLGIFTFLTIFTYAQSEKNNGYEIRTGINRLDIVFENKEELDNFDWNMLKEAFKENDQNQEITLSFSYKNNSEIDKSKVRLENFDFEITGKTSELENLTSKLKRTFEKLSELDGKTKANKG